MNFKEYDELNIYDRIAVKTIAAYLADFDTAERNELIKSMRTKREVFGMTIKAAVAKFRDNYEKKFKKDIYLKHIGAEYLRYMETIESDIYFNSVPDILFDCIEDCFKQIVE